MQFFNRAISKRPEVEGRRMGGGSVPQALLDVATWIDDVRRSAAQTADKVAAEARARSAARPNSLGNRDRLAAALMTSLAERTVQLRRDADELARLLERAAAQLETAASSDERAQDSARPPVPRVPNQLSRKRNVSEGIRLLTMQMAVAGSSKEEIERRLNKEFKVENAEQVLEEVLKTT